MKNTISKTEAKRPLTPDEVKAEFRAKGMSFLRWSNINGYHVNRVYRILNGLDKCKYGKGHEIAVKLGIKIEYDADTEKTVQER